MSKTNPFGVNKRCKKEGDVNKDREARQSLGSFKLLYLKWLLPVYHYFYYRVENAKDAEDLTSQVFLKVYEELPNYRERGYFSAWLFTLVRHNAADFFRKQPPDISFDTAGPADQTPDLLAQTILTDEIQLLRHLIRSLPEKEQELIQLRFVMGLSYREIGEMLNRKEDAIRKSISRLLARLQNQLEENHD